MATDKYEYSITVLPYREVFRDIIGRAKRLPTNRASQLKVIISERNYLTTRNDLSKPPENPTPFKAGDEWQPGAKPEFHLA